MKCPICSRDMEHHPKDELAQWWCYPCRRLFTDEFMRGLTASDIERIRGSSVKSGFSLKKEANTIKKIADKMKEKKGSKVKEMFDKFDGDED